MGDSKKGFFHPLLFLVFGAILIILAAGGRRYLYLGYQSLAEGVGINLNNLATSEYVDWIKSQPADFSPKQAVFLNKKVAIPGTLTSSQIEVLGQNTAVDDSKWIEIDLSEQRIYMKENGNTVGSFLVSTGKWAPTPKGQWRIWTKLRSTTMQGGSKALGTYYYLPNVPYTMYYNQGYGVHGAYWHNNFGQPMSHGCTNMKPEEAAIIFNWAQVGTRVIVHE